MIPYSRWNLLCITLSQIMILFFARQSPVWTSASSKPLRQGNTASNSTEGANLLFPLLLSVSDLNFLRAPRWVEPIFFHFVEVRQEEHLWDSPFEKKKKKNLFNFLIFHFLCPCFPPLFSKGQGDFCRHSPFPVTSAGCGLVSQTKLSCRNWKHGHPGKVHCCIYDASYIHSSHCF